MQLKAGAIPPPNDDKRWRIVEGTMRRHGHQSHALIEVLHTVQECFGYLDDLALQWVARNLRLPYSKVYGVATFYQFFTLKPQGKHTCVVCTGTACYIKGSTSLINAIEAEAKIKPGQTTEDKQLSLLVARCVGSCGLAPAVVFDGEVAGKVTPEHVSHRVRRWMQHDN
jgi:bidirectional [NiFe] hydrogenase diaphorase subunit